MVSGIMVCMWRNFFGLRRGAADTGRRRPCVPDGVVVYAVGDIHGQDHLLTSLLAHIHTDAKLQDHDRRILVFVGDYVDRGPASRSVLERVVSGFPMFETVALKGNHEQMLLDFVSEPELWDVYRRIGGAETLISYGVDRDLIYASGVAPTAIRDSFLAVLPREQYEFLRSLS
jgi:serine/threonine protein phosphatase 1